MRDRMAAAESSTPAATKKEKKTTVYLYFNHSLGSMAHTFFAIPINYSSNPNPNPNPNPYPGHLISDNYGESQRLKPILEFPDSEYPRLMSCVKLGPNFYFLGGERFFGNDYNDVCFAPLDDDDRSNRKNIQPGDMYPADVYMFDGKILSKLNVGMKTGKPKPVSFVADGKLFILGSCGGGGRNKHLISYFSPCTANKFDPSKFSFFEVYDPALEKWQVLDDPPVDVPTVWLSSPVVVARKVYIYGTTWREHTTVLLSFDLDTYQWSRIITTSNSCNIPSFMRCRMGCGQVIGDTFYGLGSQGVVLAKLTNKARDQQKQAQEKQLLFRLPLGVRNDQSSARFCHLGGKEFCSVVTGSLPDPLTPLHYGILDQNRRYISIRIFREVQQQQEEEEEEEPQHCSSSRAQLLYSADFLFESPYSSFGSLHGCYASDEIMDVETDNDHVVCGFGMKSTDERGTLPSTTTLTAMLHEKEKENNDLLRRVNEMETSRQIERDENKKRMDALEENLNMVLRMASTQLPNKSTPI